MNDNKEQSKKCTRCKVLYDSSHFEAKRNGELMKTCNRCRERTKEWTKNRKCEHGKAKHRCKDCGGSSFCEHGKRKYTCKECGGSHVCEHNRVRICCKECDGSQVCEHNRLTTRCKDCGGGSICEHKKRRGLCKDCGGGQLCRHDLEKRACKTCGDHKNIIIKRMYHHSKAWDKKKDLYDANNFIDTCFLADLFEEYKENGFRCYYCKGKMGIIEYDHDLVTIERLDNSIGHIKSNCVLACFLCNSTRVGQREHI